nr:FAD-dependent oxidoreductase [Bradyrhizobium manausense]
MVDRPDNVAGFGQILRLRTARRNGCACDKPHRSRQSYITLFGSERDEGHGEMKVAVLGAGVVGCATAYMLARKGHEVTVVDRRDRPGMEASFANGGLMTPSDASPWNSPGTVRQLGKMLFDPNPTLKINPSVIPSIVGWGLRFLANSTYERHKANMISNIRIARLSLEVLRSIRQTAALDYDQTTRGTMRVFPRGGRMSEFVQMCREMQGKRSAEARRIVCAES